MKKLFCLIFVISVFGKNCFGQNELEICASQYDKDIQFYLANKDSANAKGKLDASQLSWKSCLMSKQIPVILLKSISGKAVEIRKDSGKAYVLQFWASWCPPCMAEIPVLNKLALEYRNKGIEFITLAFNKSVEDEIANRFKTVLVLDCAPLSKTLGVLAYPTIYIISADLKITTVLMGASTTDNNELYFALKNSIEREILTH